MVIRKYIWDMVNDSYLLETDGNDEIIAEFTNEPEQYGRLISQRRDGETSFYHFDALGSTRQLTDSDEFTTDSYVYEAFGRERASSGQTINPFKYNGEWGYYHDDDLATEYLRARHYDASTGRFLSVDPLWDSRPGGQYTYVGNNPANATDPSGLKCPECPKKWKAPSVLGVEWQYGCYCGKEPTPPRKAIPAPIDPTDACCQEHDGCCGKAKTPAARKKCNKDFCTCVDIANSQKCLEKAGDIRCCCNAAKAIMAVFCDGGSRFC